MVDFFISYNQADRAWASWIAWHLEDAGYTTVLQDWDFGPGSNFVLEMHRAATDAERTIAVLSPDFLQSIYTAPEWAAALAQDPSAVKHMLIPVRVRPCKPTGLLSQIVRIDLVDLDEAAATSKLLSGVQQRRAKPSSPPSFPGTNPGPEPNFPGPKSGTTNSQPASQELVQVLTADEIAARVDQHQWGVSPDRRHGGWTGDVWLGMVLVPERQGDQYIPELDLGDTELQRDLLSLMTGSIFDPRFGTEVTEQRDHIASAQSDDQSRRLVAMAEVYMDGTLVYRSVVPRRSAGSTLSLADAHVIDEDAVRGVIVAFLTFAQRFYAYRHAEPGTIHLGISLSDIAMKHFGRLPDYQMSSFAIGDPRIEDPLRVPSTPLRIAEDQLADPQSVAQFVVKHIVREFRLAGAYFIP